jgi:hypothetical protein
MNKLKVLVIGIVAVLTIITVTVVIVACSDTDHAADPSSDTTPSAVDNNASSEEPVNSDPVNEPPPKKDTSAIYDVYNNSRYGYSVSYPTSFIPGEPPDNNDGQKFTSKDGTAELIVYGSNNVFGDTVEALYNNELNSVPGDVAYKKIKDNWYVVSWVDGNRIYYTKKFAGPGAENTLIISYPQSQKNAYDEIVTYVSQTFYPGNVNEPH